MRACVRACVRVCVSVCVCVKNMKGISWTLVSLHCYINLSETIQNQCQKKCLSPCLSTLFCFSFSANLSLSFTLSLAPTPLPHAPLPRHLPCLFVFCFGGKLVGKGSSSPINSSGRLITKTKRCEVTLKLFLGKPGLLSGARRVA